MQRLKNKNEILKKETERFYFFQNFRYTGENNCNYCDVMIPQFRTAHQLSASSKDGISVIVGFQDYEHFEISVDQGFAKEHFNQNINKYLEAFLDVLE